MHSTLMQEILPEYGDRIKIVYKDFPLSMHPWAQHSANDANCLAAENGAAFWEYADYVHANQKTISAGRRPNLQCSVVLPRRVSDASTMSSTMRVMLWIISTTAAE